MYTMSHKVSQLFFHHIFYKTWSILIQFAN